MRTGIGITGTIGTIGITGGVIGTEITGPTRVVPGPDGQVRIRAPTHDMIASSLSCARSARDKRMKNPWMKKNPLMSMWLSSANAAAGRARRKASAEIGKQQAELSKQTVRFWIGAWQSAVKPKRRR
jgi:hypothetical protein